MADKISVRKTVTQTDINAVMEIVKSTGFFYDHEIPVAGELVEEAVAKGKESGYEFAFVDFEGKPVGYACYGLIPCTKTSYDLYWIVVHNNHRGKGYGKILLNEVVKDIDAWGGTAIYIETSDKELYAPTHRFYESAGCKLEATFADFYDVGDHKRVYVKRINREK
ncbi:GNAT family N-acetyltransferase [Williamwhitmania taraxaci]|uniref:Acetyltransferase (GNAT) family protein n=1 Tax=Williamwhitmania taraxaci TaxID=1640674 RepID=A0A1G6IAP8_9BACT|nr:GNAT family N-acetyltransferase [Williamwhitmania taraxaci]SDC03574.1 Acetyltransferase (GNAT) family protein [Williamwhitmania taraxaci]